MATEKGLFKDDLDRFTDTHFRMSAWLLENAASFVRLFLFDRPAANVNVRLEHLVANNKFIIGYADALLDYETDVGTKECVLIEFKSRLSDPAACLRQLRAYREYLPQVTKVCVVHSDDRYEFCSDTDATLRRYFASQGIYVFDFNAPGWNPHYCALPTGQRAVRVDHADARGYDFMFWLAGKGIDENGKDSDTQVYLVSSGSQNLIRPFGDFLGVDVEPWFYDWSLVPFREMIGMKLLVDVEHRPAIWEGITAGFAEEIYTAIHLPDLSRSLYPALGETNWWNRVRSSAPPAPDITTTNRT